MRRSPGVTRWAKWAWQAVAVLPGAASASWKVLRQESGVTEFHAATRDLKLYAPEAEAYAHEMQTRVPSVYVVMRQPRVGDMLDVALVTASPYEAQDYCDSGEEIVEKIAMPPDLLEVIEQFVRDHHVEEEFKKRRRDRARTDKVEDGIGDPRIAQPSDVYRAPRRVLGESIE